MKTLTIRNPDWTKQVSTHIKPSAQLLMQKEAIAMFPKRQEKVPK